MAIGEPLVAIGRPISEGLEQNLDVVPAAGGHHAGEVRTAAGWPHVSRAGDELQLKLWRVVPSKVRE